MTVPAFLLTVLPVLFPERESAAAVCSLAGCLLFLAAERRAETKKQFVLTVLLYVLAFMFRYCRTFSVKPEYLALSLAVLFLLGLLNALVPVFDHLLIRKNHRVLAILSVPGIYVLVQYLILAAGIGNIFDPLGYAAVIPVYSMNLQLIGEYGLTFLTALILSLAADSLSRGGKVKSVKSMKGLFSAAILAVVLTAAGSVLLNAEKEPDAVLHVALGIPFENDIDGNAFYSHSAEEWKALFTKTVETAAEEGADLLVLTEEFYPMRSSSEAEIMEAVSGIVRENGIPVMVCFDILGDEEEKSVNKAVLLDGQGNVRMEYVKNNLIPYLESSEYANGPEEPGVCTVEIGGISVNTAAVICFDQNDAEYIHKIPQDTELLLIPAWEWDTANLEQCRQRNRSVELKTTVLKHSFEGFSYASGPWGLYGEMLDNRGVYETVRMLDVPVWKKQPAG